MTMPQIVAGKTQKSRKQTAPDLSVDYPKRGEKITYPRYTLRVSAPENAKRVEIAIDQEQFRPCRQASGHWWYDWSGYRDGAHEAVARLETQEGRTVRCDPRAFYVLLERHG